MGKCFDQSICREFLVRATDRAAVIEVLEAYAFAKALKGVGSAGVQQKFYYLILYLNAAGGRQILAKYGDAFQIVQASLRDGGAEIGSRRVSSALGLEAWNLARRPPRRGLFGGNGRKPERESSQGRSGSSEGELSRQRSTIGPGALQLLPDAVQSEEDAQMRERARRHGVAIGEGIWHSNLLPRQERAVQVNRETLEPDADQLPAYDAPSSNSGALAIDAPPTYV